MGSNKITVMFEQLEVLKSKQKWIECLNLAHEIEAELLEKKDSRDLLKCYLQLFELYYMQGDLAKSFNYFALTESLLLQYGQWDEYISFMQNAVKTTFFYIRKDEIESFIENLTPIAFEQEQFEVLSHCFVVVSYIHLIDGEINLAIQEAKMAYFYAKFVEEEKRDFVLHNAQLQLVLALIEKIAIDEAKYCIKKFNWTLKSCTNTSELVLVNAVQSMVYLLNHEFDKAMPMLERALTLMGNSKEIMYSTILTRQIEMVLTKVQAVMEKDEYEHLYALCEVVLERFNMTQSIFMHEFDTFNDSLIDQLEQRFEKSTNVFYLGQKLFEEVVEQKGSLYCLIIKVNYQELNSEKKEQFKQYLQLYRQVLNQKKLIISQFSPELLVMITPISQTILSELEGLSEMMPELDYPSTTIIYHAHGQSFQNFHQLFNYAFFNKLLEIELGPLNRSLA